MGGGGWGVGVGGGGGVWGGGVGGVGVGGGVVVRTLDSQSREPGFPSSCCHFEAWTVLFPPRCLS